MLGFQLGLYAYPWDIAEHGVGQVIRECHELGVNTVRLALAYHAVTAFRPDSKVSPLFIRLSGARYFQPLTGSGFDDIRVPIDPSALSESELSGWVSAFSNENIDVVPWVVATHDVVSDETRHLVQVGAFGDSYQHALCPANEQVQEYVARIGEDLDKRGLFHALELEHVGYGAFRHYRNGPHPKFQVLLPGGVEQLLSLCFCTACDRYARVAGFDLARLQSAVAYAVHTALAVGRTPRLSTKLRSDIAKLRKMRAGVVESLLDRVRAAVRVPLHLSPLFEPEVSAFHPEQAMKSGDRLVVPGEEKSIARVGATLDRLAGLGVSNDRVNLVVTMGGLSNTTAHILDQKIFYCREHGVGELSLYNYGLSSERDRKRLVRVLASHRERGVDHTRVAG